MLSGRLVASCVALDSMRHIRHACGRFLESSFPPGRKLRAVILLFVSDAGSWDPLHAKESFHSERAATYPQVALNR